MRHLLLCSLAALCALVVLVGAAHSNERKAYADDQKFQWFPSRAEHARQKTGQHNANYYPKDHGTPLRSRLAELSGGSNDQSSVVAEWRGGVWLRNGTLVPIDEVNVQSPAAHPYPLWRERLAIPGSHGVAIAENVEDEFRGPHNTFHVSHDLRLAVDALVAGDYLRVGVAGLGADYDSGPHGTWLALYDYDTRTRLPPAPVLLWSGGSPPPQRAAGVESWHAEQRRLARERQDAARAPPASRENQQEAETVEASEPAFPDDDAQFFKYRLADLFASGETVTARDVLVAVLNGRGDVIATLPLDDQQPVSEPTVANPFINAGFVRVDISTTSTWNDIISDVPTVLNSAGLAALGSNILALDGAARADDAAERPAAEGMPHARSIFGGAGAADASVHRAMSADDAHLAAHTTTVYVSDVRPYDDMPNARSIMWSGVSEPTPASRADAVADTTGTSALGTAAGSTYVYVSRDQVQFTSLQLAALLAEASDVNDVFDDTDDGAGARKRKRAAAAAATDRARAVGLSAAARARAHMTSSVSRAAHARLAFFEHHRRLTRSLAERASRQQSPNVRAYVVPAQRLSSRSSSSLRSSSHVQLLLAVRTSARTSAAKRSVRTKSSTWSTIWSAGAMPYALPQQNVLSLAPAGSGARVQYSGARVPIDIAVDQSRAQVRSQPRIAQNDRYLAISARTDTLVGVDCRESSIVDSQPAAPAYTGVALRRNTVSLSMILIDKHSGRARDLVFNIAPPDSVCEGVRKRKKRQTLTPSGALDAEYFELTQHEIAMWPVSQRNSNVNQRINDPNTGAEGQTHASAGVSVTQLGVDQDVYVHSFSSGAANGVVGDAAQASNPLSASAFARLERHVWQSETTVDDSSAELRVCIGQDDAAGAGPASGAAGRADGWVLVGGGASVLYRHPSMSGDDLAASEWQLDDGALLLESRPTLQSETTETLVFDETTGEMNVERTFGDADGAHVCWFARAASPLVGVQVRIVVHAIGMRVLASSNNNAATMDVGVLDEPANDDERGKQNDKQSGQSTSAIILDPRALVTMIEVHEHSETIDDITNLAATSAHSSANQATASLTLPAGRLVLSAGFRVDGDAASQLGVGALTAVRSDAAFAQLNGSPEARARDALHNDAHVYTVAAQAILLNASATPASARVTVFAMTIAPTADLAIAQREAAAAAQRQADAAAGRPVSWYPLAQPPQHFPLGSRFVIDATAPAVGDAHASPVSDNVAALSVLPADGFSGTFGVSTPLSTVTGAFAASRVSFAPEQQGSLFALLPSVHLDAQGALTDDLFTADRLGSRFVASGAEADAQARGVHDFCIAASDMVPGVLAGVRRIEPQSAGTENLQQTVALSAHTLRLNIPSETIELWLQTQARRQRAASDAAADAGGDKTNLAVTPSDPLEFYTVAQDESLSSAANGQHSSGVKLNIVDLDNTQFTPTPAPARTVMAIDVATLSIPADADAAADDNDANGDLVLVAALSVTQQPSYPSCDDGRRRKKRDAAAASNARAASPSHRVRKSSVTRAASLPASRSPRGAYRTRAARNSNRKRSSMRQKRVNVPRCRESSDCVELRLDVFVLRRRSAADAGRFLEIDAARGSSSEFLAIVEERQIVVNAQYDSLVNVFNQHENELYAPSLSVASRVNLAQPRPSATRAASLDSLVDDSTNEASWARTMPLRYERGWLVTVDTGDATGSCNRLLTFAFDSKLDVVNAPSADDAGAHASDCALSYVSTSTENNPVSEFEGALAGTVQAFLHNARTESMLDGGWLTAFEVHVCEGAAATSDTGFAVRDFCGTTSGDVCCIYGIHAQRYSALGRRMTGTMFMPSASGSAGQLSLLDLSVAGVTDQDRFNGVTLAPLVDEYIRAATRDNTHNNTPEFDAPTLKNSAWHLSVAHATGDPMAYAAAVTESLERILEQASSAHRRNNVAMLTYSAVETNTAGEIADIEHPIAGQYFYAPHFNVLFQPTLSVNVWRWAASTRADQTIAWQLEPVTSDVSSTLSLEVDGTSTTANGGFAGASSSQFNVDLVDAEIGNCATTMPCTVSSVAVRDSATATLSSPSRCHHEVEQTHLAVSVLSTIGDHAQQWHTNSSAAWAAGKRDRVQLTNVGGACDAAGAFSADFGQAMVMDVVQQAADTTNDVQVTVACAGLVPVEWQSVSMTCSWAAAVLNATEETDAAAAAPTHPNDYDVHIDDASSLNSVRRSVSSAVMSVEHPRLPTRMTIVRQSMTAAIDATGTANLGALPAGYVECVASGFSGDDELVFAEAPVLVDVSASPATAVVIEQCAPVTLQAAIVFDQHVVAPSLTTTTSPTPPPSPTAAPTFPPTVAVPTPATPPPGFDPLGKRSVSSTAVPLGARRALPFRSSAELYEKMRAINAERSSSSKRDHFHVDDEQLVLPQQTWAPVGAGVEVYASTEAFDEIVSYDASIAASEQAYPVADVWVRGVAGEAPPSPAPAAEPIYRGNRLVTDANGIVTITVPGRFVSRLVSATRAPRASQGDAAEHIDLVWHLLMSATESEWSFYRQAYPGEPARAERIDVVAQPRASIEPLCLVVPHATTPVYVRIGGARYAEAALCETTAAMIDATTSESDHMCGGSARQREARDTSTGVAEYPAAEVPACDDLMMPTNVTLADCVRHGACRTSASNSMLRLRVLECFDDAPRLCYTTATGINDWCPDTTTDVELDACTTTVDGDGDGNVGDALIDYFSGYDAGEPLGAAENNPFASNPSAPYRDAGLTLANWRQYLSSTHADFDDAGLAAGRNAEASATAVHSRLSNIIVDLSVWDVRVGTPPSHPYDETSDVGADGPTLDAQPSSPLSVAGVTCYAWTLWDGTLTPRTAEATASNTVDGTTESRSMCARLYDEHRAAGVAGDKIAFRAPTELFGDTRIVLRDVLSAFDYCVECGAYTAFESARFSSCQRGSSAERLTDRTRGCYSPRSVALDTAAMFVDEQYLVQLPDDDSTTTKRDGDGLPAPTPEPPVVLVPNVFTRTHSLVDACESMSLAATDGAGSSASGVYLSNSAAVLDGLLETSSNVGSPGEPFVDSEIAFTLGVRVNFPYDDAAASSSDLDMYVGRDDQFQFRFFAAAGEELSVQFRFWGDTYTLFDAGTTLWPDVMDSVGDVYFTRNRATFFSLFAVYEQFTNVTAVDGMSRRWRIYVDNVLRADETVLEVTTNAPTQATAPTTAFVFGPGSGDPVMPTVGTVGVVTGAGSLLQVSTVEVWSGALEREQIARRTSGEWYIDGREASVLVRGDVAHPMDESTTWPGPLLVELLQAGSQAPGAQFTQSRVNALSAVFAASPTPESAVDPAVVLNYFDTASFCDRRSLAEAIDELSFKKKKRDLLLDGDTWGVGTGGPAGPNQFESEVDVLLELKWFPEIRGRVNDTFAAVPIDASANLAIELQMFDDAQHAQWLADQAAAITNPPPPPNVVDDPALFEQWLIATGPQPSPQAVIDVDAAWRTVSVATVDAATAEYVLLVPDAVVDFNGTAGLSGLRLVATAVDYTRFVGRFDGSSNELTGEPHVTVALIEPFTWNQRHDDVDFTMTALCGNAAIDAGEECDPGFDELSDTRADACRTTCVAATCGDEVVDSNEQCDTGDDRSDSEPDACRVDCRVAFCGDATIDSDEECDDPLAGTEANADGVPDLCRIDCRLPRCGDGIIDVAGDAALNRTAEECDDGDEIDEAGIGSGNNDLRPNACRTTCVFAYCGDGVVDRGEECDDGFENSDTLPNRCRTSCRLPACGDGVTDLHEACDDGAFNLTGTLDASIDWASDPSLLDGNHDLIPNRCRAGWTFRVNPTTGALEVDDSVSPNPDLSLACTLPVCGDYVHDDAYGETCDEAVDLEAVDGCRYNCTFAFCGDGVVDSAEACDDGVDCSSCSVGLNCAGVCNDDTEANACRTSCVPAFCGDGVVDAGEVCDDGDDNSASEANACRPGTCTLPSCGDNVTDDEAPNSEECDDGSANADLDSVCRAGCTLPRCGDGITDTALAFNETCDVGDGNFDDTTADGCRTGCVAAHCGDGVVDSSEACDDGDDCSSCVLGVDCAGVCNSALDADACRPSCVLPSCGDEIVDAGEQCDDGAANSNAPGANCRPLTCLLRQCGDNVTDTGDGEQCDTGADNSDATPNACRTGCTLPTCGDGVTDTDPLFGAEQCDRGAANNDTTVDGCRVGCVLFSCGDDVVDSDEQCDDGAANSDLTPNGCRSDCSTPACGDGVTDDLYTEACDDGAANNNTVANACRENCELPSCGDGTTDDAAPWSEECDDATVVDAPNTCRVNCTLPVCGDAITDTAAPFDEQCDDGAVVNAELRPNGCRPTCQLYTCGDGVVDTDDEECDGGASNSDTTADACRSDCRSAFCGDGVIDSGEECDDGALNSNVFNNTCRQFVPGFGSCLNAFCGDGVVDDDEDCDLPENAQDASICVNSTCSWQNVPLTRMFVQELLPGGGTQAVLGAVIFVFRESLALALPSLVTTLSNGVAEVVDLPASFNYVFCARLPDEREACSERFEITIAAAVDFVPIVLPEAAA